jgi:hypothetical protein
LGWLSDEIDRRNAVLRADADVEQTKHERSGKQAHDSSIVGLESAA